MAKKLSRKSRFLDVMSQDIKEDVAIPKNITNNSIGLEDSVNSRKGSGVLDSGEVVFDAPEEELPKRASKEEKVVSVPQSNQEEEPKKGVFASFFSRSRSELEDVTLDKSLYDKASAYMSAEEEKRISETFVGLTDAFDIISKAEEEGVDIEDIIYLNYINDNDYQNYNQYHASKEEEIKRAKMKEERDRQIQLEKEKREKEKEAERQRKIAQEKQDKLEEERLKQEMLNNMRKRLKSSKNQPTQPTQPTQEEEIKPEPKKENVLDFDLGIVSFGGSEVETNEEVEERLEYNNDKEKEEEYSYEEEESSYGEYSEGEEDSLEELPREDDVEYEEEEDKLNVYVVGNMRKVAKNSGAGRKTPTGYSLERKDIEEHIESLVNYNVILVEEEEEMEEYLHSKSNLLIITQDIGDEIVEGLSDFLSGIVTDRGVNYHRIVTILGDDTEVKHNSVERAIKLTKQDLDTYFEENPTSNYTSYKAGFNSLDDLLEE